MSINKIILVGNVGSDPEIRTTPSGVKVANFSLATSERGYTAQNGTAVPERTEWHNITAWNGAAKLIEGYVRKGSKLYLEGKVRTRSYDDKQGIKRYVTEVHVETIELLDSKRADSAPGSPAVGSAPAPAPDFPPKHEDLPF